MNFQQGKNCIIHPSVVIGDAGFSFTRDKETLELTRKPHHYSVEIGNNVEIGANSNIARGSYTDTVIGDGTKIDALVHIGHNAKIGKNCIIVAGAVVGGSTQIGDNCWIGMNASLKNRIKVGNGVIVGAGSYVSNDVNDGDIVAGVPAKSIKHKTRLTTDELFFMSGRLF
jgi:UDP-3-O-[3-hydroxymyristoyl] glucosamine N-acyltransferase